MAPFARWHLAVDTAVATTLMALVLAAAGCPEAEVPERYRTGSDGGASEGRATPEKAQTGDASAPPAAAAARDGSAREQDGGPPSSYRYDEELPLEGNVRFTLAGGCTGCSGGTMEAEAAVEAETITLAGSVTGCEGACTAYRPVTGRVLVKRLRPRTYRVRSELSVHEITPLSLGAAKRADWAIFMMKRSCTKGLAAMNGEEQVTAELHEAFSKCLSTVPPPVKLDAISSMLTWKNSRAFVPELIGSLEDTKVAYLAARVLGRIDDRRAVGPLIEALGSEDKSLRWDARRSLEMITDEELGEDQARWKAWHAAAGER